MDRAFAASRDAVRSILRREHQPGVRSFSLSRTRELHEPTDPLLDRVVPALVVIFLVISGISMGIQYTSSRMDILRASEGSLAVAARMIAMDLSHRQAVNAPLAEAVTQIPTAADLPGRTFVLFGPDQRILMASNSSARPGKSVDTLFSASQSLAPLALRREFSHMTLANGLEASVIIEEIDGGSLLLAYQPIDDELDIWRRHAFAIAALLFAFGAVTIAFSTAFYMQRARARLTSDSARRLFNRFEVALDRGNLGLWDSRLGANQIWLSNSMFRLLGLEGKNRYVSRSALDQMIHPDDISPLNVVEQSGLGSGEIDHQFRMRHASQGWLWFHMRAARIAEGDGGKDRLLGVVMDITAEREAAAESERAEQRLRDAIESISEAFVLWDANNELVLCNSKYRMFHGLNEAETCRGARYASLMTAAHEPRVVIEIDHGSDQNSKARAYEAQFDDGRWLLISERPTRAGGYVSVGTDITTRKEQEDRLISNEHQLRMTISDLASSREALRLQAHELSKLAELYRGQKAAALDALRVKADFLANMNHEMRTPLNAIIGFAHLIETQMLGPNSAGRYQDYARDIRISGTNLLAIVEDVLEMAHIDAGHVQIAREQTPIGHLLEAVSLAVASEAQIKNLAIEIEPDIDSKAAQRAINIDINATRQALTHLLKNAARLSPHHGKVTMRARMQGDHLNIFISDRGCHLSKADISILTTPFGHIDSMLQDGCKGSGLHVAISRGLIELQGGSLRIRSVPLFGAVTMVHLPLSAASPQKDAPRFGPEWGNTSSMGQYAA
ncbi:PAS domain [Rhabdaerophilaceae bacterium]